MSGGATAPVRTAGPRSHGRRGWGPEDKRQQLWEVGGARGLPGTVSESLQQEFGVLVLRQDVAARPLTWPVLSLNQVC